MTESSAAASEHGLPERLESWKEVAVYLHRAVSTVQRWERQEGLPVHRLPHVKLGSIYALPAELDAWWAERGATIDGGEAGATGDRRRAVRARAGSARGVAIVLLFLAIGGLAGWLAAWQARPRVTTHPAIRFSLSIEPPDALALGDDPALTLSPDGRRLVYLVEHAGHRRLHLRELAAADATPLAGTEGARGAFFSPDGRRLGFFAGGRLKVLDLAGGPPAALCDAPSPKGGAWGPDGRIVFAPSTNSGLAIVSAAGGPVRPLTTLRADKGEDSHRWPAFLPGGRSVVFAVRRSGSESYDDALLAVVSPDTGAVRELHRGGSFPLFAGGRTLLFARAGRLLAARLNPSGGGFEGEPEIVLANVATNPGSGGADVATSTNGVLAYVTGGALPAARDLVRVDRQGAYHSIVREQRPYVWPRVSPDGRSLAFALEQEGSDLWLLDLERGTLRRLTSDGGSSFPVWRPDGRALTFSSSPGGPMNLFERSLEGSSRPSVLLAGSSWQRPAAWTPDGRQLVYVAASPATGQDLWVLEPGAPPRPLVRTPFLEGGAQLSPDGVWLAYVTDASGQQEVHVRKLDGSGGAVRVSEGGGTEPVWSRDGRELFYRRERWLLSVAFRGSPAPELGVPQRLFEGDFAPSLGPFPDYDVWPAGGFVMIHQPRPASSGRLEVCVDGASRR